VALQRLNICLRSNPGLIVVLGAAYAGDAFIAVMFDQVIHHLINATADIHFNHVRPFNGVIDYHSREVFIAAAKFLKLRSGYFPAEISEDDHSVGIFLGDMGVEQVFPGDELAGGYQTSAHKYVEQHVLIPGFIEHARKNIRVVLVFHAVYQKGDPFRFCRRGLSDTHIINYTALIYSQQKLSGRLPCSPAKVIVGLIRRPS
jgi:hypothetical protein